MENTMLDIKFVMFFVMEFAVVALVAILVIAGLYQFVRSKMAGRERARQGSIPAPATVEKR
jgi:hypothetical protein